MSGGAPASDHQAARRRLEIAVERVHEPDPARCVRAIVALLTYRPAERQAASDTAASPRPPRAGDQRTMHEADGAQATNQPAGFEEDGGDARVTSPAD